MKTLAVVPVYDEKGAVIYILEGLRALNALDEIAAVKGRLYRW